MTAELKSLINEIQKFESGMEVQALDSSPAIRFSNTGVKGRKFFDISIVVLKTIFEDIKNNLTTFQAISDYIETPWRTTLSEKLTDEAAKALCTVQTLPLYTVISKFISCVNNIPYEEKKMTLTASNVDNVVATLDKVLNPPAPSAGSSFPISVVSKPKIVSTSKTLHTQPGENIIYFGAPGTGKSHEIDTKVDDFNSIRTVFHAETYFSDFVGCLKPTMGDSGVEYSFQIGPFIEILIKALNDPDHHYYLVIEEINRAKSAAVFGEIFQLLDRDINGSSKYSIKINDQDLIKTFSDNLINSLTDNLLKIPENLTIYATMNSSDQAVEPMDTAFKRRWKFIYKSIDFTSCPSGNFVIKRNIGDITVSWKTLALNLNDFLSDLEIPEDRHFGPWFIRQDEIDTPDKAKETLKSKILMYLWDDVLRHHKKSAIFIPEINTFGKLVSKIDNDEIVFCDEFSKIF